MKTKNYKFNLHIETVLKNLKIGSYLKGCRSDILSLTGS